MHIASMSFLKNIRMDTVQISANTIAQIYKDRWQIELFFKALKQHLKVKSFVGTSKNALLSQLWVTLIAYLLLCYLKFKSMFGWSLYTLSSILPTNLFSRRNIWDWLNAPFHFESYTIPTNALLLRIVVHFPAFSKNDNIVYEHQISILFLFTAKRKPLPLEVVYNILKKINSKAMPLKAFWLGNHHLLCRLSFTFGSCWIGIR